MVGEDLEAGRDKKTATPNGSSVLHLFAGKASLALPVSCLVTRSPRPLGWQPRPGLQ